MTTNEKIILAVIIICIICWCIYTIYYTKYLPTEFLEDIYDDMIYKSNFVRSFKSPETLNNEIIGYHNDDTTKITFEKTTKRRDVNKRNKNTGIISGNGINELAVDSFILGELTRYNIGDDPNIIHDYYNDALDVIEQYPRTIIRNNNNPLQPSPDTILYRIEDYYLENNIENTPNFNNIRRNLTTERVNDVNNRGVIQSYVNNFNKRKRNRPRRNPFRLTKKERAVDEYFEIHDVRSDGQNVHDREVNNEMSNKYDKILELNKLDRMMTTDDNYKNYTIHDIGAFISTYKFSGDKKDAAKLVYDKILNGGTISRLKNSREDDIAVEIWKRIHSGDNYKNRENLQNAFMDALANSAEKNHLGEYKEVCVTGRCANMLGALTLMDNNKQLTGSFKTAEILKNEIFDKTYNILQKELEATDEKTRDLYNGRIDAGEGDKTIVDNFVNKIYKKIETTIVNDYPDADKSIISNLIEEAKAGV